LRTGSAALNKLGKTEQPGNSRAISEKENSWVGGRERILRRNERNQLGVQEARNLVAVEEGKGPGGINMVLGG